jgi:hypothetical protein
VLNPKSSKASSRPSKRLFEGPEQPFEKGRHAPREIVLQDEAYWRLRSQSLQGPRAEERVRERPGR